jgi:hypothetical protein
LNRPHLIDRKLLEQHRSFLVYLGRTYPALAPYLKGIQLTIDSWWPWRRPNGWKMTFNEVEAALSHAGHPTPQPKEAPEIVSAIPELKPHMEALTTLLSSPAPPKRQVCPILPTVATFWFGDASGQGFGHTWELSNNLHVTHGQWQCDISTTQSSNFHELYNLVLAIKDIAAQGHLATMELFILTDNSTAEAAFYKGTSTNPQLFQLILCLRKLQMDHGAFIHVLLVAGKRMIAQGTDGLSRGSLSNGVLTGPSMLTFIPFHL